MADRYAGIIRSYAKAPFTNGVPVDLLGRSSNAPVTLPANSFVEVIFFRANDPLIGSNGAITVGTLATPDSVVAAADGVTTSGVSNFDLQLGRVGALRSATTADQILVLTSSTDISAGEIEVKLFYVVYNDLP